jgi:signal transduction histidine kinase
MSQVQSGNYELDKEEFPLVEDFLSEIFARFRPLAQEKKLRYTLENKAADDTVYVDKEMMEMVFDNIFMNAIEYTARGKVSVLVYNDDEGRVCVRVEDTGIGISKEFLPEIFELFTQEDQGLGRKYEGNGLGLALSKRYAELNNTEILIESEKGNGSVFTIMINKK